MSAVMNVLAETSRGWPTSLSVLGQRWSWWARRTAARRFFTPSLGVDLLNSLCGWSPSAASGSCHRFHEPGLPRSWPSSFIACRPASRKGRTERDASARRPPAPGREPR